MAHEGVGNLQFFNQGGLVGGSSGSGGSTTVSFSVESVQAMNTLATSVGQFVAAAGGLGQVAQSFATFTVSVSALSEALNNMPRSLTVQGQHTVNVNLNGAEALAKLTPAIEEMVSTKVNAGITRVFREHLPDAGVPTQ